MLPITGVLANTEDDEFCRFRRSESDHADEVAIVEVVMDRCGSIILDESAGVDGVGASPSAGLVVGKSAYGIVRVPVQFVQFVVREESGSD
jgi:hypothetical protein